jgi:hypothetical protein
LVFQSFLRGDEVDECALSRDFWLVVWIRKLGLEIQLESFRVLDLLATESQHVTPSLPAQHVIPRDRHGGGGTHLLTARASTGSSVASISSPKFSMMIGVPFEMAFCSFRSQPFAVN